MKTFVAVLFFSVLTAPQWLTDFSAAQSEAQHQHKFILINFSGSDWCAPCIKMKKEVFETASFDSLATEKLILVRADFPRSSKNQLPKDQIKRNELLAEKYNPNGKFPYTVLTDAEGNVIRQWDGYAFGSQERFMSELEKSTSKH